MAPAAAFRATYADWRVIKGRKVVSISFEVPIEQADLAYQVVGGMPNPATSAWFAIARLQEAKPHDAAPDEVPLPSGGPSAGVEADEYPAQNLGKWNKIPLPQQAGILCNDAAFQKFLGEKIAPDADFSSCSEKAAAELAADIVRHQCIVPSRADIRENHPSARLWRGLVMDYRAWMLEPEVA